MEQADPEQTLLYLEHQYNIDSLLPARIVLLPIDAEGNATLLQDQIQIDAPEDLQVVVNDQDVQKGSVFIDATSQKS